ncbi:hypothetical protein [Undibacterium sp. TJN19]|uniref:hypothetical protein n=1 Tax=Undibacterium sp. TJN19 TaxID=3413055 RepID=UPI003BEF8FFA
MALVNCSECDAEVSDKAAACPKCGNPIATPVIAKPTPWLRYTLISGITLFSLFVLAGMVGSAYYNSPENFEKRKKKCLDAMTSSIGKAGGYQFTQEYRDNVNVSCEGMEFNGVKITP